MQNVYSSALSVTCDSSHNFLKIQVKFEFSLRCSVIFYKRMRGRLCNGKWLKNQDFKINLAQRYGAGIRVQGPGVRDLNSGFPGEIPFGVCTLPRLNMPTADRKAVFNGVKISRGKQGSGFPGEMGPGETKESTWFHPG